MTVAAKETRSATLLERQVTILEAILGAPDGLFLNEIAEQVGLPKPTAHRLVGTLTEAGLLARRSLGRKVYVIGPRLARLLHAGLDMTRLQRLAEPVLKGLVEQLRETAFLARLIGDEIVSVAMVAPEREWRGHVDPGDKFAVHAAASAKAILAFQPAETVARLLRGPLIPFTAFTLTDLPAIEAEHELVRRRGYAVCDQEISLGIIAYGCPVHLPGLGVSFSVALTGPVHEMNQTPTREIVAALKAAAERIAGAIGRVGMLETTLLPLAR